MKANDGHAVGYGNDPWTEEATEIVKKQFANACDALFVFNGTGSNTMALQMMTRPYHIIFCAETGHIAVDECGAPSKGTGCFMRTIATPDGKLTPELLKPYMINFGNWTLTLTLVPALLVLSVAVVVLVKRRYS